jgi:hypothetical protein
MGMAGTKIKLKLLAIEEEMAYAELQMHLLKAGLLGFGKSNEKKEKACEILAEKVLTPALNLLKEENEKLLQGDPIEEGEYTLERGQNSDTKKIFKPTISSSIIETGVKTYKSMKLPTMYTLWRFMYHKAIIVVVAAFNGNELMICVGQNTTLADTEIIDEPWISMWTDLRDEGDEVLFQQCIERFKERFVSISSNFTVTHETARPSDQPEARPGPGSRTAGPARLRPAAAPAPGSAAVDGGLGKLVAT